MGRYCGEVLGLRVTGLEISEGDQMYMRIRYVELLIYIETRHGFVKMDPNKSLVKTV